MPTAPALLRLLESPRRREILRLTWHQERSASEIHHHLGDVTFGAVSQHLRQLEHGGAVRGRPSGRPRFYRAQPAALEPFVPYLESLWEDALYRLKLEAELEERRRGPQRSHRRTGGGTPAARSAKPTRRRAGGRRRIQP